MPRWATVITLIAALSFAAQFALCCCLAQTIDHGQMAMHGDQGMAPIAPFTPAKPCVRQGLTSIELADHSLSPPSLKTVAVTYAIVTRPSAMLAHVDQRLRAGADPPRERQNLLAQRTLLRI